MDLRTTAQDVIRCDLCEKEISTMYCGFCHVNLCISCIGKHISDDYDKHKVVPFQQRKSSLIYPECTTHRTKICEFHCKDCNISVCSFCTTITDEHKGHTVNLLFDLFTSKREVIVEDIEELESIISPTYEEIATELETQISDLNGKYEKLIKAVVNQGEKWQREINIVIDKMKAEIEDMKLKHMNVLKTHLHKIQKMQSLIEQTQVILYKIEESNEISKIMEYSSTNKEFSKFPPKVQISLPRFIPKTIDKEQLYMLIGSLSPLSKSEIENGYKFKQSETLTKELLKEPKLISMINTGYDTLLGVTCHNEEEFWTVAREISDIKCFNIQGILIKTIKTKSEPWFRDMAVSKDGDLVYIDFDGMSTTVKNVKQGKTEEVIRIKGWVPVNLCFISSGDLLVSMYSVDETESKVVRYSGFKEKQTIQFDNENKPLYSANQAIKYLTENRNLDICLADAGAYAVVVVNQTGDLRFRYTGHPFSTKNKPFKPYGITTDSQSQILTSDFNNQCIHILDKDGHFLSYIDNTELKNPFGLCVDKNDYLYVADYFTGKVKRIKYLK